MEGERDLLSDSVNETLGDVVGVCVRVVLIDNDLLLVQVALGLRLDVGELDWE